MNARAVIKAAIATAEILDTCYAAIPEGYLKKRFPDRIIISAGEQAYQLTLVPIMPKKTRERSAAKSRWLR